MGENPKITLGLYTSDYTCASFGPNILQIGVRLAEAGMFGGMIWVTSCRVDSNRNYLIHDFLNESDGDFLFIVDEDMIHPDNMPIILASRNKPIISGLYFRRDEQARFHPQLYKFKGKGVETRRGHGSATNWEFRDMLPEVRDYLEKLGMPAEAAVDGPMVITRQDGTPHDGGVMRMDASGFGCLLLRRDALEQMEPPYLITEPALNGDLVFFKQAKQKGIECWADCSIIAAHIHKHGLGLKSFVDYTWRLEEDLRVRAVVVNA